MEPARDQFGLTRNHSAEKAAVIAREVRIVPCNSVIRQRTNGVGVVS